MRSRNKVPLSKAILKRSAPLPEQSDVMANESSYITHDYRRYSVSPQHLFADVSTELLRSGQGIRFRAPGRSMYPTIKEDETITVQPVSPSAVQKGDIILYRCEKRVIAHRIVGIDKAGGGAIRFTMRGDASGASTEQLKPEQILGKVVCIKRGRRRINPYGLCSKMERVLRPWASLSKWWLLRNIIRHA